MKKRIQGIRDRKILEMVRGLLLSEVAFKEIHKKYKKGLLHFSDIETWVDDKGRSILYNLKEQCHALFRYIGIKSPDKKEWLLDLAIGSIFHEAMKLRENIYQLQVYRPKYLQYKLKVGDSAYERDYLRQFETIISKAGQGVAEGMEETRSLFRDAMAQLVDFFKEGIENPYLVRFLVEHQSLLRKVYGSRGVREIFGQLFKNGISDAYQVAGRSCLEGEHYDLSSLYFSKASKMNPGNPDLQFFLNFSSAMNAYYRNAYTEVLSCFTELVRLKIDPRLKKEFLRKAEEVCRKISAELKEEKRLKASAEFRFLADQLRKML